MAREYDAYVTPYHAPIARRLLELAHVEEGERILDIGCGTGIVAFEAAAAVGQAGSVVGIDLAERAVRLAADKAAAAGLRHVHFEVMDSRALRFPAGSFDAVLSGFGHPLIERGRCFEEVRRVVGTGGRVALCTWNPSKTQSKAASTRFREILERRRPTVVPPDVARLIEPARSLPRQRKAKRRNPRRAGSVSSGARACPQWKRSRRPIGPRFEGRTRTWSIRSHGATTNGSCAT